MLLLIVTLAIFVILAAMIYQDILDDLCWVWIVLLIIDIIILVVLILNMAFLKYSETSFRASYTLHVQYLESIQNKSITTSERQDEINSMYRINKDILWSRQNKKNIWTGSIIKDIGYLDLLDFNLVPEAVEVKDIHLNKEN